MEPEVKENEFKIGDKVKVVGTISGDACKLFEQVGRITKIHYIDDSPSYGGGYVLLDIENRLPTPPGGIWFDDIELIEKGKLDLSHIKKYKVAEFLNNLNGV